MKINDVEKITGLTQKAIRLYESKGLIAVFRDKNGYRNYSDENVSTLKQIKMFRSIGVSIVDIKLYMSEVMTLDEIIEKRKSEILKESGKNSESYLEDKHIEKIAGTYHTFESKEYFSYVASLDEVKSNDFWLGIPKYVSKNMGGNEASELNDAISEWYVSSDYVHSSCDTLRKLIDFGG